MMNEKLLKKLEKSPYLLVEKRVVKDGKTEVWQDNSYHAEVISRLKAAQRLEMALTDISNLHICDTTLYTEKENCDRDHEIYKLARTALEEWRRDDKPTQTR